jgi:putative ABC transport system permease protein
MVVPLVEIQSYYSYLVGLFSLIGLSFFAVSLTLMYSSLSLMVTREYREIGTLKALGTTRRGILLTYALRSMFLGLIGSTIGVLLGVLVTRMLIVGFTTASLSLEGIVYAPLAMMEMVQENAAMLVMYGSLGVGLSLILVLPSALSASKVFASRAMRSFPGLPSMSGGSKPRFSRGPLSFRYAFRSLARKREREAAVVLVIVISVTINSTTIAASESQQILLDETSKALNFDFFICLNNRYSTTLLDKKLEPFMKDMAFSEWGYYTQAKASGYTLSLIGAPVNASYFNYTLVGGRWFKEDEDGIVLTENLAKILNAKVGDALALSNEMITVNATVVGLRQDLVFNVPIIPLSTAQKLDNSSGKVNAIVVKAKEGVNIDGLIQDIRRSIQYYFWHIKKTGVTDIAADVLTKAFQSTAAVMIAFTWVTSLFLIFSIAGQDINEERTVMTILRALGMKKRNCILIMISKLLILGLFASLLCAFFTPIILGLFSEFLSQTTTFSAPLHLSSSVLLSSVFFILATILISGLALGVYATSVKIVEALRYE